MFYMIRDDFTLANMLCYVEMVSVGWLVFVGQWHLPVNLNKMKFVRILLVLEGKFLRTLWVFLTFYWDNLFVFG